MLLQAKLTPLLPEVVQSVGLILKLAPQFRNVFSSSLFNELVAEIGKTKLDTRSQYNYTVLLYSTGKVWYL